MLRQNYKKWWLPPIGWLLRILRGVGLLGVRLLLGVGSLLWCSRVRVVSALWWWVGAVSLLGWRIRIVPLGHGRGSVPLWGIGHVGLHWVGRGVATLRRGVGSTWRGPSVWVGS